MLKESPRHSLVVAGMSQDHHFGFLGAHFIDGVVRHRTHVVPALAQEVGGMCANNSGSHYNNHLL
jgi:hypothetical protein